MKSVAVKMPDQLAAAVEDYIKAGFFHSKSDVFVAAVADFVRRNRIDLLERFAHEDITWAKTEARKT